MSKSLDNNSGRRWGQRLTALALLTGVAAAGALVRPEAATASARATDPLITASLAPVPAAHELRLERTRPGTERLELAARLHERGGHVVRPIHWTVRQAVAGRAATGEPVYRGEAPKADLRLPPGEYSVEASYGFSYQAQELTIEPGQRVGLTLILNVGGIRPLTRVEEHDVPAGVAAVHSVYALSGRHTGRRLTDAAEQGEVLRVGAGSYRIESRLEPGNAVTETVVAVKPGILSSVEIAHLAGLVRVEVAATGKAEGWTVHHLDSGWAWQANGSGGDLVLAPGRYEASVRRNGKTVSVEFDVAAGQSLVVLLGR